MARTRRGFGRIRKCQPSGRYQASYIAPDDRLYRAPETFDQKEDAEAWLADRRREIDRELWSPPATTEQRRAKRKATIKFKDYANKWLETRTVRGRPLKPRTRQHYEAMLADHLNPTFGNKPLREITMESVDRWYAKTLKDKPTMRAHCYSLLRTILETARTRDRIIDTNPCLIRGAGTTTRKIKPKPASLEELAIIETEMPERYRLMVPLSSWLAMRFGECVELRRRDISIEDKVVMIRRAAVRTGDGWVVGDPKSEAGVRDVAIPPHLIPQIQEHLAKFVGPQRDALLFPALNGGHLQPSSLYRWFYKARKAARRDDLRWHDLRHSGSVYAALAGANLAELMARLGHSSPAAALRYMHQAQGRDKVIAEALSKLAESNNHVNSEDAKPG